MVSVPWCPLSGRLQKSGTDWSIPCKTVLGSGMSLSFLTDQGIGNICGSAAGQQEPFVGHVKRTLEPLLEVSCAVVGHGHGPQILQDGSRGATHGADVRPAVVEFRGFHHDHLVEVQHVARGQRAGDVNPKIDRLHDVSTEPEAEKLGIVRPRVDRRRIDPQLVVIAFGVNTGRATNALDNLYTDLLHVL